MTRALDGLLVIAMEQAVAAPLCTVRLADGGARVIKVERLEGETARHYDRAVEGTSAYFAWLNRGKESVALDLKSAEDLALLQRMVGVADVFVQNFAPGAAARLGLGSAELVKRYPRLIAVDIVGYGQDTAYAGMRAYDMLVQAESGICAVTGTPDTPSKVGVSMADIGTGANAHAAILEALIERGRTGYGQAIEIAMFDSMVDWMSVPLLHYEHSGRETGRHGLSHASIYPYKPYACSDGEVVIAIQNNGEWKRLCVGALGRPELEADPRFHDNPSRVQHRSALDIEIAPVFASMTCAQMIDRLEANQIAWGRVSTVADVARHPALRSVSVFLPDDKTCTMPLPAGRTDLPTALVPSLGAQTDRVRSEFATGRPAAVPAN